jgi:negative regulator of flagellin synthesis FlgM
MHEHGPNCMEGPIRGNNAWWRACGPQPEPPAQPVKTTRNNTNKLEEKGIRKELVQRIRGEIAAGTYDTPEKWEAALDRLIDRLDAE